MATERQGGYVRTQALPWPPALPATPGLGSRCSQAAPPLCNRWENHRAAGRLVGSNVGTSPPPSPSSSWWRNLPDENKPQMLLKETVLIQGVFLAVRSLSNCKTQVKNNVPSGGTCLAGDSPVAVKPHVLDFKTVTQVPKYIICPFSEVIDLHVHGMGVQRT